MPTLCSSLVSWICRRLAPAVDLLVLVAFLCGTTTRADGGAALCILPAQVTLHGPAARQRVIAQHLEGGHLAGQAERAQWSVSNAAVVKLEDGVLIPQSDGHAVVTASLDGHTASADVMVEEFGTPHVWSFRNHVESVLSKVGCNSGACHGALAGKGGFKLTLRGYDPQADWETITHQARGRRIELADPGRSLILAKPSGALPHKGGIRLEIGSPEYDVIASWISRGVPPPAATDPRLERLEILPAASRQAPGRTQQLIVRAHFSDGHCEDVTRWVKFTATNETVAKVDSDGRMTIVGCGEGAVTAWYLSQIVIAGVTSPFEPAADPQLFAQAPQRNFIDRLVLEKLQELNLPPSPLASDTEFLRRAFLDTIGTLPTAAEARRFLADGAPDKRDRLIDALLERPEFIDYWTYKWSDLLLVNGKMLRPQAVIAYYAWIRQSVAANKPWDQLARELVTATGGSFENGATNFFALHQDPQEMAENVCVAFLGLNINCARCHNHPLEKWTNNQYYAMANLFSRVRAKGWGGDPRGGDGRRTLYAADEGELVQPATGRPQPPTPLDGQPLPFDAPGDRRAYLAEWLTSPDNPYFRRAITNRVWANFFGVGLVMPVDDLRVSNPASNDRLLSAAADYLADHQYDLKELMRVILQSASYQRSSAPLPENRGDDRFFSRYYPRRLMAEVLLDAIAQVTEIPTEFDQLYLADMSTEKTSDYPLGTRALQLKDSSVVSPFLKTFGRNERMITCECERSAEPSMVQVLHLANGDTLNDRLHAEKSCIGRLLSERHSPAEIVDDAYLACLSRLPTKAEKSALLAVVDAAPPDQLRAAIEDLYWSVMSSREFLFNH